MKSIFEGYVEIEAPSGDTERVKWNGIDWSVFAVEHGPVTLDMIEKQNVYTNSTVKYRSDLGDTWQHPSTTLNTEQGDCEDYAILKMAILAAIGVPRSMMALVLGEIASLNGNSAHAFLVVELDGRRYVLDSKFDQMIEPKDYVNWQPKKMLCDDGVFIYSKEFTIADTIKKEGPANGA